MQFVSIVSETLMRFVSITVIVALLCSPLLAAMPACCAQAGRPTLCHIQKQERHHHCAEMQEQQPERDDTPGTHLRATGATPERCPMTCCCVQANAGKHAALLNDSVLRVSLVTLDRLHVQQVPFRSNGFSSHTDRGPPAA